jgi:beta-lactamase regulating signal transducer with metallopeptidase domain
MLASLAQPIYFAVIHLLFASMVWAIAWLLSRSQRASATAKYWIWVVTSLYFLVPAGSIFDGIWRGQPTWATPLATVGRAGLWLADHAVLVGSVWVAGALAMAVRLALRLRNYPRASAHRDARSIDGIPIRLGAPGSGPVVDGIVRPRITIPGDLDAVLTGAELAAVLRHEVTHARRRDNLIALVHELALCVLWFHPLMWLAGGQLALYRELSCDESVLREARGADLISALAKLSGRDDASLLQASASSMLGHRLALLAEPHPRTGGALVIAAFAVTVLAGLLLTVGHTACCFRY